MAELSPALNQGNTVDEIYEKVMAAIDKTFNAEVLAERQRCAKLVVDGCREAADDIKRIYGEIHSHEVLKLGAAIYKQIMTAPLYPEGPPHAKAD
jgi:hypothetical protein